MTTYPPTQNTQPESGRPLPPIPPRRRFHPFRFLVRLVLLAFVVCIAGLGYFYVSNTAFRQTMQGVLAGVDPRSAFGGRSAITLMVLGKDEDRNDHDQVLKTNARSDSIILARLDFNAKTIQILSIPRDTRVHIPGTRGYSKINAAHAIGGADLTAKTIHDFIGVTPDSSLVVDYSMLQHVIDALGGVTVNVDKQLDYDDNWGNLHIHLKPGVQTLNGRNAMGFVRYRHANEGGGDSDLVRIQRQQQVVQAVKAKLKDPATWIRIPAVLEIVRKEMGGSLTYPQLVALANFARSAPKDSVQMHVLPNRPGRVFVYADRDAARELVARLFPTDNDSSLVSENREADAPRPRRRHRRGRRTEVAATRAAAAPVVTEVPAEPTDAPATDSPAPEAATPAAPEGTVTVEEAPAPADAAPAPVERPAPAPAPTPDPARPSPDQQPS